MRWWLCGSCLGLVAALLQLPAKMAPVAIRSSILLCLCVQLGCFTCGFLRRSLSFRQLRFAVAAFPLPGLVLLLLSRGSAERIEVSCNLVAVAMLATLAFFLHRDERPSWFSLITSIIVLAVLRELLSISVAMHWPDFIQPLPANLQLLISYTGFLVPAASTLALLQATFQRTTRFLRQLQHEAEDLRQLIESSDDGICRIDCHGLITFANAALRACWSWAVMPPKVKDQPRPGFKTSLGRTTMRAPCGRSAISCFAPLRRLAAPRRDRTNESACHCGGMVLASDSRRGAGLGRDGEFARHHRMRCHGPVHPLPHRAAGDDCAQQTGRGGLAASGRRGRRAAAGLLLLGSGLRQRVFPGGRLPASARRLPLRASHRALQPHPADHRSQGFAWS